MLVEKIIAVAACAALGALWLWVGIARWRERCSCKEKIWGTYVGAFVSVRFVAKCYAIFEYEYGGRKRSCFSVEDWLSRKWQQKHWKAGESYPLYVNPKNPNVYRCTKRIFKFEDLMLIMIGAIEIGGALVLLFK